MSLMKPIVLAILFALPTGLNAALSVGSMFGDHAVLQRDLPVPIWGTAQAGAKIEVEFRGKTKTTAAGKDGAWRVEIGPLKAGGPDVLTLRSGDTVLKSEDVLVGEVWVGSGQSNMAGNLGGYSKNDPQLAKLRDSAPFPKIRLMKGGPKPAWMEADEKNVPGFSAILFAFGERLHRELDVPVGLIVGAVGGTPSGNWLSQDAYDRSEACKESLAAFAKNYDAEAAQKQYEAKLAVWGKRVAEAEAKGEKPKGRKPNPPVEPGQATRGTIGNLYEKFIRTVVGYGIRGVLWDQGESGTAIHGVDQYAVMGALISGWRREWGQGDLPFIYVQKNSGGGPAFDPENPVTNKADPYKAPPEKVPDARDGARRLEYIRIMDYPKAHMVSAADLGSGVHPSNKWGYGNRAARVALGKVYGKDLLAHGPRYKSHKIEGGKVRIEFTNVGKGLTIGGGGESLTGFAVAGEDKQFVWADAVIDGDAVVVSSKEVGKPVAVRFACSKMRNSANLFNMDELPALAFKTDDW